MKKTIVIVMSIICIFLNMSFPAYAGNTTKYKFDEAEISIEMPKELVVFTSNTDVKDPNLAKYGFDKDSLDSIFKSRNIYLEALEKNADYEIMVSAINTPVKDFRLLSDSTLTSVEFTTELKKPYEESGVTVNNLEIFNNSRAKFIKIYIQQPFRDSTLYGLQYLTVYANKLIRITMQSYSGKISSDYEATLKSIVDSVIFFGVLRNTEKPLASSNPPAAAPASKPTSNLGLLDLILFILIAIVIYSLPIIIYRYAIRKKTVPPRKAKIITVIYAIVSFVVMSLFLFAINGKVSSLTPLLFWSVINYYILVGKEKSKIEDQNSNASNTNTDNATEIDKSLNTVKSDAENTDVTTSEETINKH